MKNLKKNLGFHLLILSIILNIILNYCDREYPIYKEDNCQLIYCDKHEFANKICVINNPIINVQWLTSIIKISDNYFRYINIVSNTKGDIIIEISPDNEGSKRIFYGLTNNGRPFFKNIENNEDTPFYIMDEINFDLKRQESELINIILNNDGNSEYLMSVSVGGYVEIYDFDEG